MKTFDAKILALNPIAASMNPQGKQFLRRVELPQHLNPFFGVISISALRAFGEFAHMKVVPAFQMMYEDAMNGLYEGKHTLVIDSSGNTAHAVVRLAQAFGFEHVIVVIAADVPSAKRNVFSALSTPTIVTVPKGGSVAAVAREWGERPGHYHLNQYGHEGNLHAHEWFTGPEIARVLDGDVGLVAIALGSGGTAGGVARYLTEYYPSAIVLGVRVKDGEQVPGARSRKKMEEIVTLPWQRHIGEVVEIGRKDAFVAMRRIWSAVEPQPGPTSGLAYAGLIAYLNDLAEYSPGELDRLRGKNMAFLCPDSAMLYSDVIIAELDTGQGLS